MELGENTCVRVQPAGDDMSCNITHICIHTTDTTTTTISTTSLLCSSITYRDNYKSRKDLNQTKLGQFLIDKSFKPINSE